MNLSYRIFWHEPDQEWVGICEQFPGLSHLDATPEAALVGILDVITFAIQMLREDNRPMPWEASALPPVRSAFKTVGLRRP